MIRLPSPQLPRFSSWLPPRRVTFPHAAQHLSIPSWPFATNNVSYWESHGQSKSYARHHLSTRGPERGLEETTRWSPQLLSAHPQAEGGAGCELGQPRAQAGRLLRALLQEG